MIPVSDRFARAHPFAVFVVAWAAIAAGETSTTDRDPRVLPAGNIDWATHGGSPHEERFSPLDSINKDSVAHLGLAWSYMTGSNRGLEATPLIVGGTLYATASWSVVFALDGKTGRELWRHDPQVPGWKAKHACCDVVNRGVAYSKGRIYSGTLDGRLLALDAKTGQLVWSTQTTDPGQPYTITGAPRVVKDLVVIGNGGAEYGVRGYFSAYHASTGELAWRFFTVPASKEGPHEHAELSAAAETWPADALWESGLGGTAWDGMAYDPELDLLYVGTGNSSVYDRAKRSPGGGDNLFLASILALRPETGELVWYYQTTPGEHWDYTATQNMILTDLEWQGRTRKVLLQAPKNGFFYVLDRATGELLSAEKFVHVSWASHVDLETGRPVERPEADWSKQDRYVAPSPPGGHNWHPMSFHPGTGLVYLPAIESLYLYMANEAFRFRPGLWNTAEDFTRLHETMEDAASIRFLPCGLTRLVAWDPVKAEKVWEVRHDSGIPGGTLATAGDLVFQGSGLGRFSAYEASGGRLLWSSKIGIDVMAPPVSYRIDGEQYIAVLAGTGGSAGAHATVFDHDNAGRVLAFKLGGEAAMPPVAKRPERSVSVARLPVPSEIVARGRRVYAENCFTCHGIGAKSSGLVPDLRTATPATHAEWEAIVRGGIRSDKGMPSFAASVSPADAEAIRAYVLERAWHEPDLVERFLDFAADRTCLPVSWITD
ncbi:MAG: PQQ-dependent dehydrogenase, methanol/ethanol family [Deltaproteobacteria bacterium]|nr:PQQ-dependent dehydrogenase, methanol/ethanol family [Deltaproteobacteria bacterium]